MNVAIPPDLKLSDFLCFSIYSANLAFGRAYKPLLEEFGITYTQYIAIVALAEEDNQTVGGLGEKLFLESNTLTPILKKLEAMGFLTRTRAAADERQVLISLTDAGRDLHRRSLCVNLAEATGLTAEEFPILQKAIGKLRDSLLKSTRDPA